MATGLSAIGPGIGNGATAKEAVAGVARHPETYGDTTRAMLIGMTLAQSTVIYGLIVSLLLLFYRFETSATLSSSLRLLGAGLCSGFGGIGPGIGGIRYGREEGEGPLGPAPRQPPPLLQGACHV